VPLCRINDNRSLEGEYWQSRREEDVEGGVGEGEGGGDAGVVFRRRDLGYGVFGGRPRRRGERPISSYCIVESANCAILWTIRDETFPSSSQVHDFFA